MSRGTASQYRPIVRKYHPQGWDRPYFAGCTRRDDASRVTDICRHQHRTEAEAAECADALTLRRNARAGS